MRYTPILCAAVLLIPSCSAKSASAVRDFAEAQSSISQQDSAEIFSVDQVDQKENPAQNLQAEGGEKTRKLIRRADLRVQSPDPETAETATLEAMQKYGAYSAETQVYEYSRSYVIRVPEKTFQLLLEELTHIGRIRYRSETAEDVTLKYYDLEGRLQTKQTLLTVFQGYLQTAKSIEDILRVESRLAELHNEIDWMGTELRALANLVDYSTINFEIQKPHIGSSENAPTLKERAVGLFANFGRYASTALLLLLGAVIYGAPSLLILFLLYWLLLGKIGLLKIVWRIASGKGKKP